MTLLSILTKLLHKIQSFGIIGTLFKWFEAYLSDRAQYVQVSNRFSELLPVLSGVPQGSIQAHYFLFYPTAYSFLVHLSMLMTPNA